MRKNKQLVLSDNNLIMEKSKISIYRENNNLYFFESNNPNLNYFLSIDYLESVSALMKLKDMYDFDTLWDIKITDEMRINVNYNKSLYWLTGGDREWVTSKVYNTTWSESSDLFLKEYGSILEDINIKCDNLGEVRDEFLKYMNLPTLYEFGLSKNIIK